MNTAEKREVGIGQPIPVRLMRFTLETPGGAIEVIAEADGMAFQKGGPLQIPITDENELAKYGIRKP